MPRLQQWRTDSAAVRKSCVERYTCAMITHVSLAARQKVAREGPASAPHRASSPQFPLWGALERPTSQTAATCAAAVAAVAAVAHAR